MITAETLRLSRRWLRKQPPEEQARILAMRAEAKRERGRRANRLYNARHPERVKARRDAWFAKNADYRREYNKTWKVHNSERHAETMKTWLEKPAKRMATLVSARLGDAKRRGIPYDETALRQLIASPATACAFCGVALDYTFGNGRLPNGPSIDRVIANKGYVAGNIAVLCSLHNTMKGSASAEEHRRLADFIDGYVK